MMECSGVVVWSVGMFESLVEWAGVVFGSRRDGRV